MTEINVVEEWRAVVGYEGLYTVSNLGAVRGPMGKTIVPWDSHGYLRVALCRLHKKSNRAVHRLVLESFTGPAPDRYECNHRNGVRHDNRLANLEWTSHAENVRHSVRVLGFKPKGCSMPGVKNPASKLTEDRAREIITAIDAPFIRWAEQRAALWGVSVSAIMKVRFGERWKHIRPA